MVRCDEAYERTWTPDELEIYTGLISLYAGEPWTTATVRWIREMMLGELNNPSDISDPPDWMLEDGDDEPDPDVDQCESCFPEEVILYEWDAALMWDDIHPSWSNCPWGLWW